MALWTPADTTTELWLKASDSATVTEAGGTVSAWDDKSGNGYDLDNTSDAPTLDAASLDGKDTIVLDGSNDRIYRTTDTDIGRNTDKMLLVGVFKAVSFDNGWAWVVNSSAGSTALRYLLRPRSDGDWEILVRPTSAGSTYSVKSDGSGDVGNWVVIAGLADFANGDLILRINGAQTNINTSLPVTTSEDNPSRDLVLGATPSNGSHQEGSHAEWVFVHDDSELEEFEGYLA